MNFLRVVCNRAGFFKKIIETRLTGKTWPLAVTFSMTRRCNFRCRYCYGDYENRQHSEITASEALGLVEELIGMGMKYLQLSGGEPLLFSGIEKIVDLANRRGICLGINTNGSLIPKYIEIIKKIQTVCVSFDGYEEANDANRGAGSYKAATEGIDAALSCGTRVHVYVTITRNNVNSIDWLMEFSKKKRIYTEFGYLVRCSLEDNAHYQGLDLDNEIFKKVQTKLIGYKKRGYPILFSKKVLEHVKDWPDFLTKRWVNGAPPFPYIPCHQGRLMIFIDCDGKIYPCIQMIGKFDALDFREVGVKRAYEHCIHHNCKACFLMCVNDFNLLFAMHPSVIMNNFKITMQECFLK